MAFLLVLFPCNIWQFEPCVLMLFLIFSSTFSYFRLGPFATLPQYGFDYWPKNAKIIQIEADPRRIGLVKPIEVGVNGDAKLATDDILARLQVHGDAHALSNQTERMKKLQEVKDTWESLLNDMTSNQANAREGLILLTITLIIILAFFSYFLRDLSSRKELTYWFANVYLNSSIFAKCFFALGLFVVTIPKDISKKIQKCES